MIKKTRLDKYHYIGLKYDPNLNIDWSQYRKEILGYNDKLGIIDFIYIDKNWLSQIRRETWSLSNLYTFQLMNVHGIKDGIREGESISLKWV